MNRGQFQEVVYTMKIEIPGIVEKINLCVNLEGGSKSQKSKVKGWLAGDIYFPKNHCVFAILLRMIFMRKFCRRLKNKAGIFRTTGLLCIRRHQ
jgi:hypothetical protein